MDSVGRLLIVAGVILAGSGAMLVMGNHIGWLGRLPGDLLIRKKNLMIYLPISTSLLLSAVISVVLYLLMRK